MIRPEDPAPRKARKSEWFPAKRSCSDTLARRPRPERRVEPYDPAVEAVRFVDAAVRRFLRDPELLHTIGRLYEDVGHPMPSELPEPAAAWARTFRSVHRWFRGRLAAIRPVDEEADRQTSYGLSYAALRACAASGKHRQFSYIYTACKNAHRRELAREYRSRHAALEGRCEAPDQLAASELGHDLEVALGRLHALDAAICRLRLLDDETFAAIGRVVGLHESSVKRRYDRSLPTLRRVLADYDNGHVVERPATPVAEPKTRAA